MKEDKEALSFVQGKSEQTQKLFLHFMAEYKKLAPCYFFTKLNVCWELFTVKTHCLDDTIR